MVNDNYKILINFNPIIFKVLLKYLEPKNEEKILDIGCAEGHYVKEMGKYVKDVRGIDISDIAIRKAVTSKIKFGDAMDLDFKENSFDKIYSLHTIEHIPNLKKVFTEISRVLKPRGISVIVYPWEPIRGWQAVGTALLRYKNPLMARKIHINKLNPKRIEKIIKEIPLSHLKSKLVFARGFHYITVLQKD